MPQKKWTNADLPSVSKFGMPDLTGFEEEKPLNLEGFEPLPTTDLTNKPTPYTGAPDRQPAGMDVPDNENSVLTGVSKFANKLYGQVATAGKEGAKHVMEGNLPAAFHDVAAPITDAFGPGEIEAIKNYFGGHRPTREQSATGGLEMAGIPATDIWEDIKNKRYYSAAGEALGTAAMFAGPHYFNKFTGAPKTGLPADKLTEEFNTKIKPNEPTAFTQAPIDFSALKQHGLADVGPSEVPQMFPTAKQLTSQFGKKMKKSEVSVAEPPIEVPNDYQPPRSQSRAQGELNLTPDTLSDTNTIFPGLTSEMQTRPLGSKFAKPTPTPDYEPYSTDVRDTSGRKIAPEQTVLPERTQGVWDKNIPPEQPNIGPTFENPKVRGNPVSKTIVENNKFGGTNYVDNLPPTPDKHGVMMTKESPFPKVDDNVLDEMLRNKQINYNNPRLEDVPIDSLRGTQDSVNPDIVKDYIKQGERPRLNEVPETAKGRMDENAPVVVRVGDENILAGGHHRAVADLANGKDTLQAVVYDADIPDELYNRLKESIAKDDAKRASKTPPQEFNPDEEPTFARSGKGVKIGQNIENSAQELTTGYTRSLPAVMVREAFQNAKDAIHHLGNQGRIHVDIQDDGFTIADNGKGMSRHDLQTVMSDLNLSGKVEDENATGGKGIGKATYLLGGAHVEVRTVKEMKGQKIEFTMAGTHPELMKHVDIPYRIVDPNTPTGTKVKVQFTPEQIDENAGMNARNMYRDIQQHSRDLEGHTSEPNNSLSYKPIKPSLNDEVVGETNIEGNKIKVLVPKNQPLVESSYLDIHVLNNGMYQYSDNIYLGEKIPDMPDHAIIDVAPGAKERTPEYPFPTQRESLKANIDEPLKKYIQKVVIDPQKAKFKNTTQQLYDSMESKDVGGIRKSIVFDPGKRFTDQELNIVNNNQTLLKTNKLFDKVAEGALTASGQKDWADKLEGIGTMFSEPGFYGVHVPNPSKGKSSIMVNFLNHIERNPNNPQQAAFETISTLFHELGHIGKSNDPVGRLRLYNEDLGDPRLGEFMKMYFENVTHGAETSNYGHAADWLARTAEIMTKYGPSRTMAAVDELTGIFTRGNKDANINKYNGQTESLLQLATERRGRPETTKDYLSPTGIKSESTERGTGDTESSIDADTVGTTAERPTNTGRQSKLAKKANEPIKWSPKAKPPANKTVPAAVVKDIQRKGNVDKLIQQGGEALKAAKDDNTTPRDEKEGYISKSLNFQRTVLTAADLSAPGRQGLPLIGRKEWWTSWKPMFEALGSDKGYELVMDSIKNDPSGLFVEGAKGKSFANEAKLALTDTLDHREELFRSKWAEDFAGTKWFVKPSVRAYTAYLNKLRADTFKNMVKEAGAENDLVTAKKIADFVNIATGRGNLGVFEPAAKPLAQIFFSPRLTASRLQMYTRTFNPKFYNDMPPVVRQNQLRSMLALAGTGLLIGQLSKGIGATVNLSEPDNTDFGKIRFGNTRIDPFGGHQQFLVAAARLAMGTTTSSTTGKTSSLTSGKFGMPTRAGVFGNFMKNKLAPVPAFVWGWMEGKEYDGTPFSVKQELVNKTAPIVTQDLYQIWKDNPELLPGLFASASAFVGGGVQTYGR